MSSKKTPEEMKEFYAEKNKWDWKITLTNEWTEEDDDKERIGIVGKSLKELYANIDKYTSSIPDLEQAEYTETGYSDKILFPDDAPLPYGWPPVGPMGYEEGIEGQEYGRTVSGWHCWLIFDTPRTITGSSDVE